MSIFKHPYATTAGSGFLTQKATSEIEEAVVKSDFGHTNAVLLGVKPSQDKCVATVVAHTTSAEEGISSFAHPLPVKLPQVGQRGGQQYIVSDARAWIYGGGLQRVEDNGFPKDTFPVRNATEFSFIKLRTILSAHWFNGEIADFRFLPKAVMGIYAQWISQNLARRFSLDGGDQMKIAVVAAAFYDTLCREDGSFTESEINKLAGKISQVTYAQVPMVISILDALKTAGEMRNIDDLCAMIVNVVQNERVHGLTSGLLISVINRSWFGTNSSEISAVALEHIPTWVTMVFCAFNDRGYKNSPLADIAKLYRGSKGEDEVIRSVKAIMVKACS